MILNEDKFLEEFSFDIPKECKRDFTLVTRQIKQYNIDSLGLGSDKRYVFGNTDKYFIGTIGNSDSLEEIYYSLPNNYKYQLKFIIPRADKTVDNRGLILPVSEDSKNYFDTFLKNKLTQENGFVSYNKIYNPINTKIPEKYRCSGNYIIGCKFLPIAVAKSSSTSNFEYIFVFDISEDIGKNKSDLLNAMSYIESNFCKTEVPTSNDLYFIMFDFNIEGYSKDNDLTTSDNEESLKDLLYNKYGNVFPREPYRIIHKKYLGDDLEILVYKRKDDINYSNALSNIPGIKYRIGSGHDKFVMVWESTDTGLYDSVEDNSEITGRSVSEALEKEGHKVIYDSNDPIPDIAVYNHNFDGTGGYASLEIFISKKQGIITIQHQDLDSEISLRNLANLWDLEKNSEGVAYKAIADLNGISVIDIVKMVNDYFSRCKNS